MPQTSPLVNEDACFKFIDSIPSRRGTRDEVFTTRRTVEMMLDLLPVDVWKDPNCTWFDPAAGAGVFIACVYFRLIKNMPRRRIIKDMLFMQDISRRNCDIMREIFGHDANIRCGDSLKHSDSRYTVVLGNPPYNRPHSDMPLYQEFVMNYIDKARILLFVMPSRWMAGGKSPLLNFRNNIRKRRDIKQITHFENSLPLFKLKTDVNGGVQFFLKDAKYDGMCNINGMFRYLDKYDIIVWKQVPSGLIDRIANRESLTLLYSSINNLVQSNDARLSPVMRPNYVPCLASAFNNGLMFVDKAVVNGHVDFNKYKVVTPRAFGTAPMGRISVMKPGEMCTNSFIVFACDTSQQAKSLTSYLQTDFVKFMVSTRKITKHLRRDVFTWVPIPKLATNWTDCKIQSWLNLSAKEMRMITKRRC
jgi:site-specific DNA-methyltransferase (adenine-specific)